MGLPKSFQRSYASSVSYLLHSVLGLSPFVSRRGLDLKEFADQLKSAAEDARNYGKIALEVELDRLQKQLRMMHDQVQQADFRRSSDDHFCPTENVCQFCR